MISLITLLACGPKDVPVEVAAPLRINSEKPAPLEAPSFQLPELTKGTLSNGLSVAVSENHETPLVYVKIVFHAGTWTSENPNLAVATLDMLNEGAGDLDAMGLSAAQRKLAAEISSSASLDGSVISLSSLKKNIDESLGLFAQVVQKPTFPENDWNIIQKTYVQDLNARQEDPSQIASDVFNGLSYDWQYRGRLNSIEQIQAVDTKSMKNWYSSYLTPANASIFVGGDITLEEVQPLLEAHFGSWAAEGQELPALPKASILPEDESTTIYLINKTGASQSVIYGGHFVTERTNELAEELYLANLAVGGLFIARINTNLREDKGWTYGARSSVSYSHLPGLWKVSSSVVAEHTADSVQEIMKELRESQSDRPITQEELDAGRGYMLGTNPLSYEQADYLLNQMITIERYNLPVDWFKTYPERLRAVSLEQAQEAWNTQIDPANMRLIVVGDAASLREPLANLGLSVVELDSKGQEIKAAE